MAATSSKAPLVSVIVATYRCDDYLRLALASILAQTHTDFEVLVADDGGEDVTQAVVESFQDSRLVYYRNPVRLGPAGNHWAAMRQARGEYIAILNHDDLWQPEFLHRLLAGFADGRVVVAFCDFAVVDSEGDPLPQCAAAYSAATHRDRLAPGLHLPFPVALSMRCTMPMAQGAVFKKAAIDLQALPPEVGPAYDFWLNYLLIRNGDGAFYVAERLAIWRNHATSITMQAARSDWPMGAGVCLTQMAGHPFFRQIRPQLIRYAAHCYASAALAALRGGRTSEARRHARRALRQNLPSPRTLVIGALSVLPRVLSRPFLGS